jgi:hypothetical protein
MAISPRRAYISDLRAVKFLYSFGGITPYKYPKSLISY